MQWAQHDAKNKNGAEHSHEPRPVTLPRKQGKADAHKHKCEYETDAKSPTPAGPCCSANDVLGVAQRQVEDHGV